MNSVYFIVSLERACRFSAHAVDLALRYDNTTVDDDDDDGRRGGGSVYVLN